jgi:hypothetical protein
MIYKVYLRAREGRAPLLGGGLEEEWGEEPELFYILGPVPTLAWVAQVSAWWRAGGGVGGGARAFLHPGSCPHPSLGSAGQ